MSTVSVTGGRRTMSATTAAFLGSGRRMWATVAPPTTVNRACDWRRNLIQLRTLVPATLASATGPGCAKTRSDLVVMLSGARISALFCSPRDHSPQNSGCICTAQTFHTWSNSGSGHTQRPANQLSKDQRGHIGLALTERRNGTVCRAGCLTEDDSDMHS